MPANWELEVFKAFAPAIATGGAGLLLAWLAVPWALRRYKAEKTWDRRTDAFAEVIFALRELRTVKEGWRSYDPEEGYSSPDFGDRSAIASKKLREAAAVGELFFNERGRDALHTLLKVLDKPDRSVDPDEYRYVLHDEVQALDHAILVLAELGRTAIDVDRK